MLLGVFRHIILSKKLRGLVKRPINFVLNFAKLELRRKNPGVEEAIGSEYFMKFLRQKIDCILYVGANHGQYFKELRKNFPDTPIYLYEPDPELVTKLRARLKSEDNYIIRECAVGSKSGNSTFYRTSIETNLRLSSSLLEMAPKHKQWSKDSIPQDSITVEVITLDSEQLSKYSAIFLKIDVQGYELEAFKGSINLLENRVAAIDTEVSFQELYHGEANWIKLCEFLENFNFNIFGVNPWGIYYKNHGELLQADLQFVKKNLLV